METAGGAGAQRVENELRRIVRLGRTSELGRDDVGVVLGPVVVESGWDDAAGGVGGSGRGSELFGRGSQGSEAVIAKQYELGTEGITQLLSTERIAQFARMAVGD